MHTFDTSQDLSLLPGLDERTQVAAGIASQFTGVREKRAVAAARHFPTIRQMMCASPDQWAKVPGIGKVLAKSLVDMITREGNTSCPTVKDRKKK